MTSRNGEVVLSNLCISGTEIFIIYYDLSIIRCAESEEMCWNHDMFYFNNKKS